ncbi:hypothetical protein, partial [uncultured Chryseobacterium sp.]|uniref:hypothetical protein n=1 Tax=uncultured Chryseobacterium sp. TaxID=259322 RepID=UPI00260F5017
MKKLYLVITLLLLINHHKAQNQDNTYKPQIYPVSPAVAEFGKYGNYPVDLSSGLPQIEIPLYTVKSGNIELPVKLMYHASGIKTGQESSWVGLGWSLSAGGQVNVEVRDTPDENESGVYNVPNVDNVLNYMISYPYNHLAFKANYLNRSWVKDAYQIQLPTVNGEFYRGGINDNDLKFPKDDYRIKWGVGPELLTEGPLEITDIKGTRYYFKEEEKATRANNPGQETYTSAYLLTKMQLNEDIVEIKYQNQFNIIPFYNYSQSQTFTKTTVQISGNYQGAPVQENLGAVTNQMLTNLSMMSKRPSEILFKDGRLRFILGQDFGRYAGKYLQKIIVEKKIGNTYQVVKFINFYYSLFNVVYNPTGEQGRLRLDKVEEESSGDVIVLADLHYNNDELPTLNSFSQDYFGYYNSANNQDLIPKTYIKPNTFFGSANRNVNIATNQNGILKEIVFPTKGKTSFEYETNTFFGKSIHGEYSSEPIDIGGLILNNVGQGSIIPKIGYFDFNNTPPTNYCNQGIQEKVLGGNLGTGCPGGSYCCEGRKFFSYNMQNYPSASLLINWYITNTNPDVTVSKYAYAKIVVKNHGNIVFEKTSKLTDSGTFEVNVTQGDISCSISVWGETISSGVNLKLAIPNSVAENNQLAGGLRVKSITNYDSDGTFIGKKKYDYHVPGTTKSSGKLVNQSSSYNMYWDNDFNYHYSNNECCSPNAGCHLTIIDTHYRTMGSNSNGGAFKHNLIYEYVTEKEVDQNGNSKGSRVVKYNVVPDIVIDSKSSLIIQDNKYKRNLAEEIIYDSNNTPLKKIKNIYIEDMSKASLRKDFKVFMHKDTNVPSGSCAEVTEFSLASSFEVVGSTINIPRQFLKYYEETNYYGGDSITTRKELFNESLPTVNITKEIITYPDNTLQETTYKYAHEKGNQLMIGKNMIGIPLETETKQTINGTTKTLSKTETVYPTSVPTTQTGNLVLPVSVLSFNLQSGSPETEVTFDKYDSKGNLLQYTTKAGSPVAIV